ncbi:hypothetical protein [Lactococcus petauri]|uniref:hypothetical protein n=1 Tax=Lactococcus petauri TaxID=1940789 RepID=UPI0013025A7F|nr:hypothetical protein [Lactococcus petauri]
MNKKNITMELNKCKINYLKLTKKLEEGALMFYNPLAEQSRAEQSRAEQYLLCSKFPMS